MGSTIGVIFVTSILVIVSNRCGSGGTDAAKLGQQTAVELVEEARPSRASLDVRPLLHPSS
jgi:RNA 3'-terminal phosphate cyclase